jgi:RHS repeat-associated protein
MLVLCASVIAILCFVPTAASADITLSSTADVSMIVTSGGGLIPSSLTLTSPGPGVQACSPCDEGDTFDFGAFAAGRTLTFTFCALSFGLGCHTDFAMIQWNPSYWTFTYEGTTVDIHANPPTPLIAEQGGPCNPAEPETVCQNTDLPVNGATGAFWHTFQDAYVPGNGMPLDFTRTYSSLDASNDGSLGYGWTDGYAMSLSFDASGDATVTEANGAQVPFYTDGSGHLLAPAHVLAELVANSDGTYTYSRIRDRDQYEFNSAGELIQETDPNGYTTTLGYMSGQLTSVTDPSSRSLSISYAGSLISTITDPAGNQWSYEYDDSGNLTSVTMAPANGSDSQEWQYAYDSDHRLLTMTDPDNGTTQNTYDDQGQVTQQVDPASRTTTFSYSGDPTSTAGSTTTVTDGAGNVTVETFQQMQVQSVTHGYGTSDAAATTYEHDPNTLEVSQIQDPDGNVTSYTYDAYGNMLTATAPGDRETSYAYNGLNEVTSMTDPLGNDDSPIGNTTTYTYDSDGNPTSESTPLVGTDQSQTWGWTYGDSSLRGDPTQITDPDSNSTTYTYDSHGDVASVQDAKGNLTTYGYDTIGERTSMISPAGEALCSTPPTGCPDLTNYTTSYSYGQAPFEATGITAPSGSSSFGYNGDGALTSAEDANGNTTTYTLNGDNQVTQVNEPTTSGSVAIKTTYYGDGTVDTEGDGDENLTTYVNNPLGLPQTVSDPKGRMTSYAYNLDGLVTTVEDPESRSTTYGYDSDNELHTITYSDGTTPNVSYDYNADGERTSMSDGTGTTGYEYDSLGRLISTTDGNGDTVGYGYDLENNATAITYPNGQTVSQTYDSDERLHTVTDWLGNETDFAYDPDSNLATTTYPSGSGDVDSYGYNRADQLNSIDYRHGSSTLASVDYTRYPTGQVETSTENSLPEPAYGTTENYQNDGANNLTKLNSETGYDYDTADELTTSPTATYSYDTLGERTSMTPTSGSATDYGYDQAGNLDQVAPPTGSSSNYSYNGDGLLASNTTGSSSQHLTWNQIETPELLSDGTNSYIYGPAGLPIEQINNSTSAVSYLHHDQLGSTRLITNSTGTITGSYTYTPYGTVAANTGSATTPLQYAGQYTDPHTGLQYLQARWYDPNTAQFLTPDPLEALTRQAYSYSLDDPTNLTDPTGLDGEAAAASAGCAAGEVIVFVGGCGPGAVAGVGLDELGNLAEGAISLIEGSSGSSDEASAPPETAEQVAADQEAANETVCDDVPIPAAEDTTTLYRAVNEDEFNSAIESQEFSAGPNSMEGKWVAEQPSDALQWGQKFYGNEPFHILQTEVPSSYADSLFSNPNLDGIGPARYADDLGTLNSVHGGISEYTP